MSRAEARQRTEDLRATMYAGESTDTGRGGGGGTLTTDGGSQGPVSGDVRAAMTRTMQARVQNTILTDSRDAASGIPIPGGGTEAPIQQVDTLGGDTRDPEAGTTGPNPDDPTMARR